MRAHLSRRCRFSASHRLHSETYSVERNQELYGKCNNPHGHGHNYLVQVTVSGEVDGVTGMVYNLSDLDSILNEIVVARFDQMNLNSLNEFKHLVPTTENLSIEIYHALRTRITTAKLERVRIEETSNNTFTYEGN